jgi:hypothetical protein
MLTLETHIPISHNFHTITLYQKLFVDWQSKSNDFICVLLNILLLCGLDVVRPTLSITERKQMNWKGLNPTTTCNSFLTKLTIPLVKTQITWNKLYHKKMKNNINNKINKIMSTDVCITHQNFF